LSPQPAPQIVVLTLILQLCCETDRQTDGERGTPA